ncbi:UPF0236 family transposase-like protein [Lactococcus allomyrinae]|uniref:ISLre2 family transposase n=1 Tax=Lactococcus allomyrinae TaxID=2419773 RepID=A0A387BIC5_9LACT|nr:UPF0236 family protein [Lactococcus allomyrinae]AYG01119.1 ISLre2 family transposase [Lactococcus allomyrinae]
MVAQFDELAFELESQKRNIEHFLEVCKTYEDAEVARLIKSDWKVIRKAERTVTTLIGDVPLIRKCLRKEGKWKKPLDEWLGLEPYVRLSPEMNILVAETMIDLSFRKSAKQIRLHKHVELTKDSILKVRQLATKLYQEREAYREYEEHKTPKRKISRLYLEGDGVSVDEQQLTEEQKAQGKSRIDLAHFVAHEGVVEINKENRLIHKHRVIKASNPKARELMKDYLDSHYEITKETLLITNSDMGSGYTPEVFKDFAKFLGCKWEHHWDQYHLDQKISDYFKFLSGEDERSKQLEEMLRSAIRRHIKKDARLALNTAAALVEDEASLEKFEKFSERLLRYFQYTKPAHLRGYTHEGMGIVESQNTYIADRMKHRKMSWLPEGAETLAQLIIDSAEGTLRDLFTGKWREEWQKIEAMPTASYYLKEVEEVYEIKQVVQRSKSGRRLH